MKIDAHQHFWKYNPDVHSWISPQMKAIRQDFLPKDLKNILEEQNIDGTVAIQADQSESETDFLITLGNENQIIKGIVGWVDLQNEKINERLDYYSSFPKLKGFRHVVQSEIDPEFMFRPAFKKGISALEKHKFTYDILIYAKQLKMAENFVQLFPNQPFVINHIAKPDIKNSEFKNWAKGIKELAKHENTCCKISGLVTENDWYLWNEQDFKPYLDIVFEAFGTKRLLFGSDWPVCMVAAAYSQVFEILNNYLKHFSGNEKDQIFGLNAKKFYRL